MTLNQQITSYKNLRENGIAFVVDNYTDCDRIIEALDLFEKQEAGRIIELPVPIGTEVYKIWLYDKTYTKRPFDYYDIPFLGKTIFATREEAEARLKELRGEE